MSFDEKYQLLELVEDASAKTFIAREISTGRKVSVFLFVGEQVQVEAELITRLSAADPVLFPELIETGRNQGTVYVVTQPLSGFSELKQRALQPHPPAAPEPVQQAHDFSKVGVWHVPAAPNKTPGGPSDLEPQSGSFTQMFQSPAVIADIDSSAVPRAPEPVPGSFTQLFQAPAAPIAEPTISVPASSQKEPELDIPAQERSPGEFTRLFQSPAAPAGEPAVKTVTPPPPAEPAPAAPPMQEPAPGEFTRLFQSPAAPLGEPAVKTVAPPPPSKPAPATPPPQEPAPGEFTRLFQSPAAPFGEPDLKVTAPASSTPIPAAPKQQSGPGEFTRFFQSAPVPSGPVATPPKPAGQGEFTKVFGGGTLGSAPQQSAGQFTRVFGTPDSAQQPGGAPAGNQTPYTPPPGGFTQVFGTPSMVTPAAPQPESSGPGEYTRMFGVQTIPPVEEPVAPGPAAASVPEASAPVKQASRLPLILGAIIVLLIAVIVVLLITMRK